MARIDVNGKALEIGDRVQILMPLIGCVPDGSTGTLVHFLTYGQYEFAAILFDTGQGIVNRSYVSDATFPELDNYAGLPVWVINTNKVEKIPPLATVQIDPREVEAQREWTPDTAREDIMDLTKGMFE